MSKENIVIISEYSAPDEFKVIYEKKLKTSMNNSSRKVDTEKLFILR